MTRQISVAFAAVLLVIAFRLAPAQTNHTLSPKLRLRADIRSRYDNREGVAFGAQPNKDAMLFRTRLGLIYTPVSWLRITGTMQDARAPLYGPKANGTVRDSADFFEGYFDFFSNRQRGLGFSVGRADLRYGDGRLIGTSNWGNVPRSFDSARVYYRLPKARFEVLFVSPVPIRVGEFNRPTLGEHMYGTYNSFPTFRRGMSLELFALRREQNRPGGFTGGSKAQGTDKLSVNTFGFHLDGKLVRGANFLTDVALQTGRIATAQHRAAGGVWIVNRRWMLGGRRLDLLGEYKYASGTADPKDAAHTGTFDQLYASNHDRFGHQDLFGWRNIHHIRSLGTIEIVKNVGFNLMHNEFWLASARDALYSASGSVITRSPDGAGGTRIGRELDVFVTYKYKRTVFGTGYGYLFKGEYIRVATPGVNSRYVYCFQSFTL